MELKRTEAMTKGKIKTHVVLGVNPDALDSFFLSCRFLFVGIPLLPTFSCDPIMTNAPIKIWERQQGNPRLASGPAHRRSRTGNKICLHF